MLIYANRCHIQITTLPSARGKQVLTQANITLLLTSNDETIIKNDDSDGQKIRALTA